MNQQQQRPMPVPQQPQPTNYDQQLWSLLMALFGAKPQAPAGAQPVAPTAGGPPQQGGLLQQLLGKASPIPPTGPTQGPTMPNSMKENPWGGKAVPEVPIKSQQPQQAFPGTGTSANTPNMNSILQLLLRLFGQEPKLQMPMQQQPTQPQNTSSLSGLLGRG